MIGTWVVDYTILPTVPDVNWRLMTALDINNDGAAELIWRNNVDGSNYVWYLNGPNGVDGASLPSVYDLTWKILGAR